MSTPRSFDFPVSTLIRDSKRLLGALADTSFGPPVANRLKKNAPAAAQPAIAFAPGFETQIARVEKGGTDQSTAIGGIGELTQEQATAFTELERLTASARRTASLAFPTNDARLRGEFQVGIHDPQDFASELERAGKIHAACAAHATALAGHGWIAEDTTLLGQTITLLNGGDDTQEAAKDRKQGLTVARNLAANALYKSCLTVQNAARLAFPSTRADKDETVVEARHRYLLDEFPPRGGASAGDNPDPNGSPTPPPPAK